MDKFDFLYSAYSGPIGGININTPCPWETSGYAGNIVPTNFRKLFMELKGLNINISDTHAGGKGIKVADCLISSLGEFVERFLGMFSYFYFESELVFGSFNELNAKGYKCLDLNDMGLFTQEQYKNPKFPFTPFTKDSKVRWIRGYDILKKEYIYVPAQLILPFYIYLEDEAIIGYSTSGGLSFHSIKEEALYRSIIEIVERDALNVGWYCDIKPIPVDIEGLKNIYKKLYFDIKTVPSDIKFYIYKQSCAVEEVNVIVAVSVERGLGEFSYICGGGADINPILALLKAYSEYAQAEKNIRYLRYYSNRSQSDYLRNFLLKDLNNVDTFFKSVLFYGIKGNSPILLNHFSVCNNHKLYIDKNTYLCVEDTQEKLNCLLEFIKRSDNIKSIIIFELFPRGLFGLDIGFLMKAFSPDLCPAFSPRYPYLGHKRLKNIRHTHPLPFP